MAYIFGIYHYFISYNTYLCYTYNRQARGRKALADGYFALWKVKSS